MKMPYQVKSHIQLNIAIYTKEAKKKKIFDHVNFHKEKQEIYFK